MLGLSHILSIRKDHSIIKSLRDVDYKIFSQNGEDGIIDYLLFQLNIEKPKFLEIGVGDYSECNTRFLYDRISGEGTIIDVIKDFENKVKKNIKKWRGNLTILNKQINSENILTILNENKSLLRLDLFSIDIDGIDYWIIKKLPKHFCKVAVLEFNPLFGKDIEVTVPNLSNFDRKNYHYSHLCFGMSIKAAINIMEEKGFYFVGTNLFRNNAFFVSNEFEKEKYFKNLKIIDLSEAVNANFRESRTFTGDLNYLRRDQQLKEISNCEVIDLSNSNESFKKIGELIKIN